MNEIFESEEFLNFEKLCNARKVSFVVSVTKFSSVHKPKKGPVYVMSDFFVYDIPEDWERLTIRVTPHSAWLNPKELPPLSHPLSKLLTLPSEIKENFIDMWNHIHGVMTESYFCPKLYLTRIPRVEVEKFMDPTLLPPGSHLSCCDLVYFPVFVTWLKSPTTEDKINGHTRIRFVGLLIHLAYQLYKLDPETHVKSSDAAALVETATNDVVIADETNSKEEEIEILTPSKPQPKTPDKPIEVEEDIEILTPEKSAPEMSCTSTQTPTKNRSTPDKRPPMVSIASDIVHALEEIEILTPKKTNGTQQPPNNQKHVVRKLSITKSHDSSSMDEVTEIEILTPSKKKPETGFNPVIDCIDLEDVVDDEPSKAKDPINSTNNQGGLNSMVFTKSSTSGLSSGVSSSPKVEEEVKTKPKPTLQLRKDLWGKQAEVVDITDDDSFNTSVISVNTSVDSDGCSRTTPSKLKSREELKSMLWGKDDEKTKSNNNKDDGKDKETSKEVSKESDNVDASKATVNSTVIKLNVSGQGKSKEKLTENPIKNGDVIDSKTVKEETVVKIDTKDESKVTSQNEVPDAKKKNLENLVSCSLGKLIQVCLKLLPKKEYTMFSRKVTKYLNNLSEEHQASVELARFIENKSTVIEGDAKNKYVHMKEVFDEMKKFRNSDSVSETSESNKDQLNNSVILTTSTSMDDKENVPEKQLGQSAKNDKNLMEADKSDNCLSEGLEHSSEEVTKNLSLKEVMQSFLEMCKKSLAGKVFQPYFRQILKYMNNLDPAHLNSLPLKVFVHQHSQENIKGEDTIDRLDDVICEILKYQKGNKRALVSDELASQPPPKKKICLTTISRKVPSKESVGPIIKDTLKSQSIDVVKGSSVKLSTSRSTAEKDSSVGDDIDHSAAKAAREDKESTPSDSVSDSNEMDTTSADSEAQSSSSDIFQSLGLRPKKCPDVSKANLGKDEEAKSTKSEDKGTKSEDVEMEKEKPSSSKQCFNENLVHEKDKKKQKKKVSAQHIVKLEKALKKCAKEVKRLEEAEVDWDDDSDSNYILCAKYKRRYMDLFNKIADYKELSSSLDRKSEKRFICTESRYPEINKKIQKFVNRTKEFPDFQDVKKLVKEANSTLHLNSIQINDEAENIFQSVGKKLKKRREIDDTEVMVSYLKEDQMEDPASKNVDLDKILIVQAVEGKKNLNKYFDDFYSTHVINAKSGDEVESGEVKKAEVVEEEAKHDNETPIIPGVEDTKAGDTEIETNHSTADISEIKSKQEDVASKIAPSASIETDAASAENMAEETNMEIEGEIKADNITEKESTVAEEVSCDTSSKVEEEVTSTGVVGNTTSDVDTKVASKEVVGENAVTEENVVKDTEDTSTVDKV